MIRACCLLTPGARPAPCAQRPAQNRHWCRAARSSPDHAAPRHRCHRVNTSVHADLCAPRQPHWLRRARSDTSATSGFLRPVQTATHRARTSCSGATVVRDAAPWNLSALVEWCKEGFADTSSTWSPSAMKASGSCARDAGSGVGRDGRARPGPSKSTVSRANSLISCVRFECKQHLESFSNESVGAPLPTTT